MTGSITVAIDAMGGDLGHATVVAASVRALEATPDLHVILVGDRAQLSAALTGVRAVFRDRIELESATGVITMDESPLQALRSKEDSSMRVALNLVKEGRAQACLSSGNTGALVALSKSVLRTLAGIKRPAILRPIPSINGVTVMLDLGANAVCTPSMLCEFAIMGSTVAHCEYAVEKPRIGLLNIGTEHGKGTELLNEAHTLLEASNLEYVGFIEGNHIFTDAVDVVVSDGFTGNVALKTMEGFADYFAALMRRAGDGRPGYDAMSVLLDPRTHNGASLVGLNGIVIKSHGSADETATFHAIELAAAEIHSHLPEKIAQGILRYGHNL